jgi:hypothetical protein
MRPGFVQGQGVPVLIAAESARVKTDIRRPSDRDTGRVTFLPLCSAAWNPFHPTKAHTASFSHSFFLGPVMKKERNNITLPFPLVKIDYFGDISPEILHIDLVNLFDIQA